MASIADLVYKVLPRGQMSWSMRHSPVIRQFGQNEVYISVRLCSSKERVLVGTFLYAMAQKDIVVSRPIIFSGSWASVSQKLIAQPDSMPNICSLYEMRAAS